MNFHNSAGIAGRAEQNWVSGLNGSTTSNPTFLTFETTDVSGGRVEKARLTGSGNLGIGSTTPTQKLEVNGGVRINTVNIQPACDSNSRATFWVTQGTSGVKDKVDVCAKDAADVYAWRTLY